jgi:hypothetical protein
MTTRSDVHQATPTSVDADPRPLVVPTGRRTGRSIGAVVAGLFTIIVTSTASDATLRSLSVFPPIEERMSDGLFALALSYRIVFGVLGCYVAARLAPARPMAHALLLGAIGVMLSTLGAIAMWDSGPGWYSLGNIAIVLPCAWLGAKLYERRR